MSLRQDLSYALRGLRKSPALSVAVIATLALGIGVNTSVFSVVYGVLLRPLPYPDADRLVTVWMTNPAEGIERDITSYPNLQAWRERSRSFEQMVAVRDVRLNLTGAGDPEETPGQTVTEGYFEMLRVPARLGRTFTAEEESPDGPAAVVLSHELWTTRFGSDPAIVGRTVELNGTSYPVVGVMPPGMGAARFWLPQKFEGGNERLRESWGSLWLPVMGRLAEGVSIERAQDDMSRVSAQIGTEQPAAEGYGVLLEPRRNAVVGETGAGLIVLLAAVLFVLLIACANIANLLLARAAGRRRELAVRVALGASRTRLVQQVLSESLVLAFMGGLAGLTLAIWGTDLLVAIAPADMPRLDQVRVDGPVLLFTLAVSVAAGLLFGIAPAWRSARSDPGRFLSDGRGDVPGADRVRPVLVIGQFALALVLLAGAGLLMRSFQKLQQVDPGFRTAGVLSVTMSLPARSYGTPEEARTFFDQLVPAVAALPGVEDAGLISNLFLQRLPQSAPVFVDGGTPVETEASFPVAYDAATPGIFSTLGMNVISGRAFGPADGPESIVVAVVNESFVHRYLPGQDAVGRRFAFGTQAPQNDEDWITIAGVIADSRRSGVDQPDRPSVLIPYTQYTPNRMTLMLRAQGDPLQLVQHVRDAVRAIDPQQPLSTVRTLDQMLAQSVAPRRFVMVLLMIFAACATVLAAVGIHGVLAYAVGQRTREIGVRMALGAHATQVLGMVVGQAMRQSLIGLAIGFAAALASGRLIRGQLFGVSATDPLTLGGVTLILLAVAVLASVIPAWRAAHVQPLEALRDD